MRTCQYAGKPFSEPRSHPWTTSSSDPEARYHDLTASPGLIRTALEDFRPFAVDPAIEAFYTLLGRLNQPGSSFESSDCAFNGPHPSEDEASSGGRLVQCDGRVMLLFRNLARNTAPGALESLERRLHLALIGLDTKFRDGLIGTTLIPVRYLGLPAGDDQQLGGQLMISFWAFGDSEAEVMHNLKRVVGNLSSALHTLARRPEGTGDR